MKNSVISLKTCNEWIMASPIRYYLFLAIGLGCIACIIDLFIGSFYSAQIWINIQASIVEIFLLGMFIVNYNEYIEKQRLIDEIYGFRPWDDKEAMIRISALIRKLNGKKVYKLDLFQCYLVNAPLRDVILKDSNLIQTVFRNANLINANLQDSLLVLSDLRNADLTEANLKGANFRMAMLSGAKLENAIVDKLNWISYIKDVECEGKEEIDAKYYVEKRITGSEASYIIRSKNAISRGDTHE